MTSVIPQCGRYISGDSSEVVRYISHDAKKRNNDDNSKVEEGGFAIVAHTSVPFGLKYVDTDMEEVKVSVAAVTNGERCLGSFPSWNSCTRTS